MNQSFDVMRQFVGKRCVIVLDFTEDVRVEGILLYLSVWCEATVLTDEGKRYCWPVLAVYGS